MTTVNRLLAACCLAVLSGGPAQAGLFDDAEARRQIEAMRADFDARLQEQDARLRAQDERLKKAEATIQSQQLALINQVEALRQELARMRGMLEVAGNDIEQSQKRQKDFYVDLDARLRKLETDITRIPARASEPAADPGQEARDYEAALNLLKGGRHINAAFALKQFIGAWPKSNYQPGAHFWLATAYAQGNEHQSAKDTFGKMLATWPDDPLAPDAMLGLASSQQELKEVRGARSTLESLVAKYPNSEAAKTAKQRLGKK